MMAVMLSKDRPISITILAIGGQGGGVLTSWLTNLAEAQGWYAQSTSVPGVAQRTGATIYHVEIIPRSMNQPVLSMMPVPGEVDLLVAAEFSEVARAIQRNLVSRERTTLVASTHRALAIAEKSAPARAEIDAPLIEKAARRAAKAYHAADMAAIAGRHNSVISASLFGAIAASGVLPFERSAFEEAIKGAGVGVTASLAAFAAGFDAVANPEKSKPAQAKEEPELPVLTGGAEDDRKAYQVLCQRIVAEFPHPCRQMLQLGLNRVVDFQDVGYGAEYLERIGAVHEADRDAGGEKRNFELTSEMAKYFTTAMAYNDVIRVADLKTRQARFNRVRRESGAGNGEIIKITEYMHPRLQEICSVLPARFGRKVENSKALSAVVRALFEGGKRVRTDSIFGHLILHAVSAFRSWRPISLRHEIETAHMDDWTSRVMAAAPANYELAVEIARCQRLIKGYSDTHERSLSKFGMVVAGIDSVAGRKDAADWARRLREAALVDAEGEALDGALKTVASFSQPKQRAKAS
ncbi:MAG: indolepyruvate oxidoreductase subunit beta family protein [Hyphomicrobiales bacterium]